MNNIHEIPGLDHQCIRCGGLYKEHTDDLGCVDKPDSVYSPKGPQIPFDTRVLIQRFEDAAVTVFSELSRGRVQVSSEYGKKIMDEYKRARFTLFCNLQYLARRSAPPTEE
jgi:hypothetical protein